MSTFQGEIQEIPGLSVDRFDGQNVYSTVYFLSHCHSDHMSGLNSRYFQEKLIEENRFLYASNVSAVILRGMYPKISRQIRELPLEQVSSISLEDKYISVTCIPAGHCPGSVMFLFENNIHRVLYTGDYRINPSDLKKFKCFYDAFNNVKSIDKIYLDTTFFLRSYPSFPKREDSLSELCKVISSWITQDRQNCVKICASAKYGYEYVFKEIYERFKMPVHVENEKYKFYSLIPELDQCITTDGMATQIHSCRYNNGICDSVKIANLRYIKLSAFRWKNRDFKTGLTEVSDQNMFFVCYSTHASYEEGLALIDFLKPKDIHICVERPDDPVLTKKIKLLIEEKINEINEKVEVHDKPKLFCIKQTVVEKPISVERLDPPPEKIMKINSFLDSPPR